MPRVFVIQKSSGKNLTPAYDFGRVVIMLDEGEFELERAKTNLRHWLNDFTDEDYIIAMGSPKAMMAVGGVLRDINGGRYKLLEWDRQTLHYRETQMQFP
jgi:hypothetical protein